MRRGKIVAFRACTKYEPLGFTVTDGNDEQRYFIMMNGLAIVGLLQGMFERNILTLNPGLDHGAKRLEDYTDIRKIHRRLKDKGLTLIQEADESGSGPASVVLEDPDGNPVLIDQFF